MPIELRFDDLDLREEAPSGKLSEADISANCTTTDNCTVGCTCNSRNTCSTNYC